MARTKEEKLAIAEKKTYYKYIYDYTRHNPQLGTYHATSTVIASSDKEAEKLARKRCNSVIYGSNAFDHIESRSGALVRDVDYRLEAISRHDRYGYPTGVYDIIAQEIPYWEKVN